MSDTEDNVLTGHISAGHTAPDTTALTPASAGAALESGQLLTLILDQLSEDGAIDVVSISLAGKSSEADTMVVASGRSTRQVAAIAEKMVERLKQEGGVVPRVEGKDAADWVLIDAGDVIVHVFRPEVREFYQLEKMWQPAPDAMARSASG